MIEKIAKAVWDAVNPDRTPNLPYRTPPALRRLLLLRNVSLAIALACIAVVVFL